MTLIAYADGKLYADRLSILDVDQCGQRILRDKKLFFNKEKSVAIACCGTLPHRDDVDLLVRGISMIVSEFEIGAGELIKNEKLVEFIFADRGQSPTYLILTRKNIHRYSLRDGVPVLGTLDKTKNYAHGSGGRLFHMCMKRKMSVHDAYEKISDFERTVSSMYDSISHTTLKSIKERDV
jgi:hypothetical protein